MTDERKGDCQGNQEKCSLPDCPKFGLILKQSRDGKRRVKGCGDPVARGKRNRAKGDSKARKARRKLGLSGANTRHEEHWRGALRVEIKAGAQIQPIATRFNLARSQSNEGKAVGDIRPFAMVAMPDGESDGIVLMSLSDFSTIFETLLSDNA